MRLPALLLGSLLLAGCNAVGQVQAGPLVGKLDRTTAVGGELDLTTHLDMAASREWLDCHLDGGSCEPPEIAGRGGASSGFYVRGSNLGFGIGVKPGLFVGSTSASAIFILAGGGRFGLETLRGTAYGSAGAYGAFTAGFTIDKTYDPRAHLLCRELTYLTFGLQGSVDAMPAAILPHTVPAVSLLVGIAGVSDSGAPSDRKNPDARCPR